MTATPKVASPAPSAYGGTPQRGRRARGSPMRGQKVSALALAAAETMSIGDEDAEGEEDVEEGPDEGEQDESIYCFCQQKSYGEVRFLLLLFWFGLRFHSWGCSSVTARFCARIVMDAPHVSEPSLSVLGERACAFGVCVCVHSAHREQL